MACFFFLAFFRTWLFFRTSFFFRAIRLSQSSRRWPFPCFWVSWLFSNIGLSLRVPGWRRLFATSSRRASEPRASPRLQALSWQARAAASQGLPVQRFAWSYSTSLASFSAVCERGCKASWPRSKRKCRCIFSVRRSEQTVSGLAGRAAAVGSPYNAPTFAAESTEKR